MVEFNSQDVIHSAFAFHQRGLLNEAKSRYRLILILQPAHADMLGMLSIIGRAEGAWLSSARLMRRSLRIASAHDISSTNAVAVWHGALAEVERLLDVGETEAAGELVTVLADLPPNLWNDLRTLHDLAVVEQRLERYYAALNHMTAALALHPEEPPVREAHERTMEAALDEAGRLRAVGDRQGATDLYRAIFHLDDRAERHQAPCFHSTPAFLTIGIPTWNYAKKLGQCLEMLTGYVMSSGLRDIEIAVFDNGSTDETPDIARDFCHRHDFVSYYRSPVNIGFSGNVSKMFLAAASEYLWMFSDSKRTSFEVFVEAVRQIREAKADIVMFSTGARERPPERGNFLDICRTHGLIGVAGFISCVAARTERLKDCHFERYHLDPFVHCPLLLEAYADGDAVLSPLAIWTFDLTPSDIKEKELRWKVEKWGDRYALFFRSLQRIVASGRVPDKLPVSFFSYDSQNNYVWDWVAIHYMKLVWEQSFANQYIMVKEAEELLATVTALTEPSATRAYELLLLRTSADLLAEASSLRTRMAEMLLALSAKINHGFSGYSMTIGLKHGQG